MWIVSNSLQISSFLWCVLFGAAYRLFYDFFRALRASVKFTDTAVFFQDIIYFAVISVFTFIVFLGFTCGQIRLYIFAALALGFLICSFTLSKLLFGMLVWIFEKNIKFIRFVKRILGRVFGYISLQIGKVFAFFGKICKNTYVFLKNILKRKGKIVYTERNV